MSFLEYLRQTRRPKRKEHGGRFDMSGDLEKDAWRLKQGKGQGEYLMGSLSNEAAAESSHFAPASDRVAQCSHTSPQPSSTFHRYIHHYSNAHPSPDSDPTSPLSFNMPTAPQPPQATTNSNNARPGPSRQHRAQQSNQQPFPSASPSSSKETKKQRATLTKRPLRKPTHPLSDPRTAYSVPLHVVASGSVPSDSSDVSDNDEEFESGDDGAGGDEVVESADEEPEEQGEAAATKPYPRKDWSRAMPKDFDSRHQPSLFLDAAYAARRIEALKAMRGKAAG
ncbi:hypothetical protein IWX49DRAFT_556901 [Phyllosticta citricarpa]